MDLQNVEIHKAVDAEILDSKLKGLKWISPKYPNDPLKEISLIKEAIQIIKKDERNKIVMSDYQFISFLTEQNLNIPNRWYTHDNNSYPLQNHRHFSFYKEHINQNLEKNKIKVVYTIGQPKFSKFKIFLDNTCFESKNINEIAIISVLRKCN